MTTEMPKLKPLYPFTPEGMWLIEKKENSFGIEGYDPPRKYFDVRQIKSEQQRLKSLESRNIVRNWPPSDWKTKDRDGNEIIKKPVRPNYLDSVCKWANSYNNPPEKGKEIEEKKAVSEKKELVNKRKQFLEAEQKKKEEDERLKDFRNGTNYHPEAVEKAKSALEAFEKERDEKLKNRLNGKYDNKKPHWGLCDKITIVADAEFCGQQNPFYETSKKDDDNDKDKPKREFFPKIDKTSKYPGSPKWKFSKKPFKLKGKHKGEDGAGTEEEADPLKEAQARRNEIIKQKEEELKSQILDKARIDKGEKNSANKEKYFFNIDVPNSYNLIRNRGRFFFQYRTPYKTTKQFLESPHKVFAETIGPDRYFQTPFLKDEIRMAFLKKNPDKGTDEDAEKNNKICDRRKLDKRIYYPMNTTIY